MRIAFGSQPVYSHLVPALLPLAKLAASAGHDVGVTTSPTLSDHVREFGLLPLNLPNALGPADIIHRPDLIERLDVDVSGLAEFGQRTLRTDPDYFAKVFAGPVAGDNASEAIQALGDFQPDLIVQEAIDYPSYYAAEYLGIPSVVLDTGPLAPFDHAQVLTAINQQRERLGLETVTDPWHPFRRHRFGMTPESFYPEHLRIPTAGYFRPPRPAEDTLDPAIADLPDDRPMVLATLGSGAARVSRGARTVLDVIIDVLGRLPVTGVVALGAGVDPADRKKPTPENVHLTSFVQQELLLPACDAFITHGGFSGVRESLSSGVPMVVLPLFAEQPANADRVEQLGAGRKLHIEDVTHESLRTAVAAILEEDTYRNRARGIQREFLALPPFNEIIPKLTSLAKAADEPVSVG